MSLLSQSFISQPCSWFHTSDNYPLALTMQSLSGIGVDRLGSFSQCVEDSQLKYFLVEYLMAGTQQKYYTGVCYSSNCTASDLMYVMKSVNEYITLPFDNYRVFQPHPTPEVWNPYTISMISLMLFIIVPVILATLLRAIKGSNYRGKGWKIWKTLDVSSSFAFLFQKTSNNQRMKVMAGLRAFAFLGMTLFSLMQALSQIPSNPQYPPVQQHIIHFYYMFDLWLLVSGFYFSFELSKQWSKDQSLKNVIFKFLQKAIKAVVVSFICILWINFVVHNSGSNPLWSLTIDYFENSCNFNVFGSCSYGLWIWVTELQMSLICMLLFILWNSEKKHKKKVYISVCSLFLICSFLISFFFGKNSGNGDLQGTASKCPIVSGLPYLIGFNFGLLYFGFRTTRDKSKLLIIRIFKYRMFRILIPLLGMCCILAVYAFFLFLQQKLDPKINQMMYFLFHILVPLGYTALIIGQIVGFENACGALLRDHFMSMVSRLSFCSYTLFYGVALMIINSRKEDLYINVAKVLCLWVCSLSISIIVGLLLCVFVEIPTYRALQMWLGRNNPKAYIQFY